MSGRVVSNLESIVARATGKRADNVLETRAYIKGWSMLETRAYIKGWSLLETRAYIKGWSLIETKAVDINRKLCGIDREGEMSPMS